MSRRKLPDDFKPVKIINISVWEILLCKMLGLDIKPDEGKEYSGSASASLDMLKIKNISEEKENKLEYLQPYRRFKSSKFLSSNAVVNVSFESLSGISAKAINRFPVTSGIETKDNDLKKLYLRFAELFFINNYRNSNAPEDILQKREELYEFWYKELDKTKFKDKDQKGLEDLFTSYVIKQMRFKFMDLMKYYLDKDKDFTKLFGRKKRIVAREYRPRLFLYKKGFVITLPERKISYTYYKRSASKAKQGDSVFIAEELYKEMMDWTWLGLKIDEKKQGDLTSLKAYEALVMSSIIGTVEIPPNSILMLDSAVSGKISGSRKILVKDGNDSAKLISEEEYNRTHGEFRHQNILWDGQALLDSSLFKDANAGHGMMLLRNSFFKACAFNTNMQQYFKDKKIETVTDMFGKKMKAANVRMIVTVDSFKFIKFAKLLGMTEAGLYKHWLKNIDDTFGIVKQEEPSNLGHGKYHEVNYQILNTLPLTTDDISRLIEDDLKYIDLLRNDKSVMLFHLQYVDQSLRKKYFIKSMLKYNPEFDKTGYYRNFVREEIAAYKTKMKNGRIKLRGDMYTLCSMPYELLEYASGKKADEIKPQLGENEVYISGLEEGLDIPLFRNPHMNSGSVCIMKSKRCKLYDKYFNFRSKTGSNIIVVSPINSNVMVKLGGADFDSDTVLYTSNEIIIKAVKELGTMDWLFCGGNEIPVAQADDSIREGTKEDIPDQVGYALNDDNLSTSAVTIGAVSNTVQLMNSIFWEEYFGKRDTDYLAEIYDRILMLSILNELEIDKSKHEISINITECKNFALNKPYKGKRIVTYADKTSAMYVPEFLYNPGSPHTNKKREGNPYWQCPVDQIAVVLSKLGRASRTKGVSHEDIETWFDCSSEGGENTILLKKMRTNGPELIRKHQSINKDTNLDDMKKTEKRNEETEAFLHGIRTIDRSTMAQLFKYAFAKYQYDSKDGKHKKGELKYPGLAGNDARYIYLGLLFSLGHKVATDRSGVYHEEDDPAIACIRKGSGPATPELRLLGEGESADGRKTVTIWGDTYVYSED
ncbi:MAG: hypothetical protein J5786_06030 [Clostridiales bacterium]|nr:hypothetical protein [Clostridiales bacterium]